MPAFQGVKRRILSLFLTQGGGLPLPSFLGTLDVIYITQTEVWAGGEGACGGESSVFISALFLFLIFWVAGKLQI